MTSGIYDPATWSINCYGVKTDIPSHTWCRAPGSTEGISIIETIMEHIARVVKKDPTEVKMANRRQEDSPIPSMIEDFKKTSDFDKRVKAIEKFNKDSIHIGFFVRLLEVVLVLQVFPQCS
ncbi:hypothetical protein J6590_016543 [Homalodisca vitripennis]|nr:hypothetical protein J6590_016543 [Homalodisca vitripennis]